MGAAEQLPVTAGELAEMKTVGRFAAALVTCSPESRKAEYDSLLCEW